MASTHRPQGIDLPVVKEFINDHLHVLVKKNCINNTAIFTTEEIFGISATTYNSQRSI
jgi:hypothetical protein